MLILVGVRNSNVFQRAQALVLHAVLPEADALVFRIFVFSAASQFLLQQNCWPSVPALLLV